MLSAGQEGSQIVLQQFQVPERGNILVAEGACYLQIGNADARLAGSVDFVGLIGIEEEQASSADGEGSTAYPYLTAALQGKA